MLGTVKHTLTRWARRLMRDNRAFVRRYFDHVYRDEDPYAIADDPLEKGKRDASIAALEGRRFGEALEIGGGEGLLAARLAEHVDSLVMLDLSDRALERARVRLEGIANVRIDRHDVVADPLPGTYDLIVCSEVLVYVPPHQLEGVRDKLLAGLEPDGRLLLVHSRSLHDDTHGLEFKDFGAKTIHELFARAPGVSVERDDELEMYRVTLLHKP